MSQIPPIENSFIDEVIKSEGPYDPNLDKTQGVKLRELVKLLRDRMEEQVSETKASSQSEISSKANADDVVYKITQVNGKPLSSDISLTSSDVPEGSNLYYSDGRVDSRIDAQKGTANGLAALDGGGKLSTSYFPESILGSVTYKGTYDPSSNTPALPNASTSKGWYYIIGANGSYLEVGFQMGDWIISDGMNWQKVDNNNNVTSVAGKVGAVTLNKDDVGLSNVDNTSDANKPISTATQAALGAKADLLDGKVPESQLPTLFNPNLEQVTSGANNNETTSALLVGSNNYTPSQHGLWLSSSHGIYKKHDDFQSSSIEFSDSQMVLSQSYGGQGGGPGLPAAEIGNISIRLGKQTPDQAGISTANRFSGADALNDIDFVTLGQVSASLTTKADLVDGKVPASQLPSYVDDVLEYPNLSAFPTTGENGKIYMALDVNKTYRWGGSAYVEIGGGGVALGETASTAYSGDKGKIAYDHSQVTTGNPHNVTKADVGLSNVDNVSDANKPISSPTQAAIDLKAPLYSPTFTGVVSGINAGMVGLGNVQNTSDAAKPISIATQEALNGKQATLVNGVNIRTINSQPLIGGGDFTIDKNAVGLSSVDNTSDLNKPVSLATTVAIGQKQDKLTSGENIKTINSSSLLGNGNITIDKTSIGLSNVDNTNDVNKPISTATQTALNLKQNKSSVLALTAPFVSTSTTASNVTGWTIPVVTGKKYKIEIIADYQTAATTTGCKLIFNLASGTGTIKGSLKGAVANTATIVGVATDITKTITAVTGETNSGLQTSGVSPINTPHFIGGTVMFNCTGTGTLNVQFASEVSGSSAQLNTGSILSFQEI